MASKACHGVHRNDENRGTDRRADRRASEDDEQLPPRCHRQRSRLEPGSPSRRESPTGNLSRCESGQRPCPALNCSFLGCRGQWTRPGIPLRPRIRPSAAYPPYVPRSMLPRAGRAALTPRGSTTTPATSPYSLGAHCSLILVSRTPVCSSCSVPGRRLSAGRQRHGSAPGRVPARGNTMAFRHDYVCEGSSEVFGELGGHARTRGSASLFPQLDLHILDKDPGYVLALWRRVFILALHTGPTTGGALLGFDSDQTEDVGLLVIGPEGTSPPGDGIRVALTRAASSSIPRLRGTAVVYESQGFVGASVRAMVAGLQMGHPASAPMRAFQTLGTAAPWLATCIHAPECSAHALAAVLKRVRELDVS